MGCLCSKDSTAYHAHQPPTGKKVVAKKIETASKTGVLSLQQQNLAHLPSEALQLVNLKTLDVSGNRLQTLPEELQQLLNLKTLHAQANALQSTSDLSVLSKLQTLTLNDNNLLHNSLGNLPVNLITLNLSRNRISALPVCVIGLNKLQTLDLSYNQLTVLDGGVAYCVGLVELILDDNMLSDLPEELSRLPALKSISIAHNRIAARTHDGQQSIPAAIFVQTPIQKLVLTGNPISKAELFEFAAIDAVLDRRKQLKDRNIQGGGMVDYDVFGLD